YRQSLRQKIYPPAVARLVKLLYLADIEWRKSHGGEPLANLTWKFLHFGPYAVEFAALLGNPDMEIQEIDGEKQASRKFDRLLWDVMRSAYGRPHVDESREILYQGFSRRLDWQCDRVRIGYHANDPQRLRIPNG